MLLLLQILPRYGFFGIHGIIGILLGFLILFAILVTLWKIFEIVAKRGWLDGDIIAIARIILGLVIFLWFVQIIFGVF